MQLDQLHPRIQATEPETGLLTPFFFRWLVQLYERVGGPNDFINDLTNELYKVEYTSTKNIQNKQAIDDLNKIVALRPLPNRNLENHVSELEKLSALKSPPNRDLENRFAELEKLLALLPIWKTQSSDDFQVITTSTTYTTTGKQIIIVTSNTTITLNTNPKDKETVIVKRDTTAGTVTVSGTIDGGASYDLIVNYEAIQCVYSYDNSSWYIV